MSKPYDSKPDEPAEPFLSRWSRRKQAIARGHADEEIADAAAQLPPRGDEPADSRPSAKSATEKEPELDLSKLPKVDELTAESDITAFLDKRVPAMLRNAALNRIWSLDPTIRDFIEVAENQWNWNVPGGAPFYEEILTVPGEATAAIAKAGDSVGSLLADASPTAAAGAARAAPGTADVQLKDEPDQGGSPSGHAAAQHDAPTSDCPEAQSAPPDTSVIATEIKNNTEHAAPQSAARTMPPQRPRHGGALPA